MPTSMSSFSPPPLPAFSPKTHFTPKPLLFLRPTTYFPFLSVSKASTDNGAGISATVEDPKPQQMVASSAVISDADEVSAGANGAMAAGEVEVRTFGDPRWIGGTWDLRQFQKDGETDWDAVIDAEVKRRRWLEDSPESTRNDEPILFDTSIIPWWAWVKRFHLPEAELLNGRAAMVGFFMAYLVDSLTGVGLVDQMGNFFCKTLLFVAVVGVLLIRKNEDLDKLKKLVEETTFYDKQWQATWKDETSTSSKKE
ncbi:hypothetical protein HS088_TW16G00693 [Tripterygium wilfordii]|uniref:Uncharacterized protein n=1 Tax=Tripterygium wilfordii TaxID=458696 RepID=A0A7J7CJR4_TRIWF|nr:light-harvesting complex-like protein 3 isotype 2, chloroplastic [Tripterygium wilfordii]KAF5734246.1 hypothetical protein HS088_TW16G00693 [Tripterygium wilfordii]